MGDEARQKRDAEMEIMAFMASIAQLDVEIEASKAEADRIEEELASVSASNAAIVSCVECVNRERWSFSRNTSWFEETLPQLGERSFKCAFRVTPATFRYIVESVRPLLERQDTNMRKAIPVDKRVAVGLYRLCSSAEERSIAELFAVGRSTVNEIHRDFCEAVIEVMEAQWVKMPTPDTMAEHIMGFDAVCQFPQTVGALDGCHFPVSHPQLNAVDYRNYKGWYSVILLALVDHRYRFLYMKVISPGRCPDALVLTDTKLERAMNSPLFRQPLTIMGGIAVPLIILCDQAFPLTTNLIKPFSHRSHLTAEQRVFNYRLSKARGVVENAFGMLKARFRFIMKRTECKIENARLAVRTCCTLNVCEQFGDAVLQQWLTDLDNRDDGHDQPQLNSFVEEGTGSEVRAALVDFFSQG